MGNRAGQRKFLSTPSARRATRAFELLGRSVVFLSTPSARRATRAQAGNPGPGSHFYPRPPRGGRLICYSPPRAFLIFLSTPSARRATRMQTHGIRSMEISIHALREEGDCSAARRWNRTSHFYPRPPRGGRRGPVCVGDLSNIFLSTPSARRATHLGQTVKNAVNISIHALREEGDRDILNGMCPP